MKKGNENEITFNSFSFTRFHEKRIPPENKNKMGLTVPLREKEEEKV